MNSRRQWEHTLRKEDVHCSSIVSTQCWNMKEVGWYNLSKYELGKTINKIIGNKNTSCLDFENLNYFGWRPINLRH